MQLSLLNISKQFDETMILQNLSFHFSPGTISTIIGDNGSGKTTLLNIIGGYDKPDHGTVLLDNCDITGLSPVKIARLGVGRLFQKPMLFQSLSALNNIILGFREQLGENPINNLFSPKKVKDQEEIFRNLASEQLREIGFEDDQEEFPSMLSFGECKLIAVAAMLVSNPSVLLIDEPSAGLSKENIDKFSRIIQGNKKSGKTIILIEHNLSFIQNISDSILQLKNGQFEPLRVN